MSLFGKARTLCYCYIYHMKKVLLLLFGCLISLTGFSQKSTAVYVFMAEECPVCNYVAKSLKKVSEEYNESVKFIAVFPQKMRNYKTASLFKKKYGLENFNIEIDHDLTITKRYQASITPEVVVVNDQDEVLYQGRINNSYAAPGRMRHGKVTEDLNLVLQEIANGKSYPKPWPNPIGCYITM